LKNPVPVAEAAGVAAEEEEVVVAAAVVDWVACSLVACRRSERQVAAVLGRLVRPRDKKRGCKSLPYFLLHFSPRFAFSFHFRPLSPPFLCVHSFCSCVSFLWFAVLAVHASVFSFRHPSPSSLFLSPSLLVLFATLFWRGSRAIWSIVWGWGRVWLVFLPCSDDLSALL
jgi:hypothetical protein